MDANAPATIGAESSLAFALMLSNAIPSLAAQMLVSARMCGTTHAEP